MVVALSSHRPGTPTLIFATGTRKAQQKQLLLLQTHYLIIPVLELLTIIGTKFFLWGRRGGGVCLSVEDWRIYGGGKRAPLIHEAPRLCQGSASTFQEAIEPTFIGFITSR